MDEADIAQHLIYSDEDFVNFKRYDNSLAKLLERYPVEKYPDGCPDRIVALALMIDEEDVRSAWEDVVVKLRFAMGVDDSL